MKKEMTQRARDIQFVANQICDICGQKSKGIVRGIYACNKHFSIFQRDNDYRHKHNIDITDSLDIFKPCFRNKCTKKTFVSFKDIDKDIFCSEDCEIKEEKGYKYYKTFKRMKDRDERRLK